MPDKFLDLARSRVFAAAREWVRQDAIVMRVSHVTSEQEKKLEDAENALRSAVERLDWAERSQPS